MPHPAEAEQRPWKRRAVLWSGAILVGLAAVFFAETTTWAYDTFVRMIAGRAWIALLITPPVFAAMGWITSRKLPGARGSGSGHHLAPLFPHVDPAAVMLLGMAGYLAGVTQTPLTAAVISLELTNNQGLVLPIMAVCLLARAFSGLLCKKPIYSAFADRLVDDYERQRAADSGTAA